MDLSKILSILAGVTLPLAVICVGAWLIYQARQNLRSPDATESDVLEDLENAYREGELDPLEFEKIRDSLERQQVEGMLQSETKHDPQASDSGQP